MIEQPEPVDPYRPPRQWTRQDLADATARGDHDRITAAHRAGQLADVIAAGNPEPDATPRGGTWDHHDIAKGH